MVVNKNYYSSVSAVKASSYIKPVDFGLSTDIELDTFIEGFLFQVKDLIDTECNKNFSIGSTFFPTSGNLVIDSTPAGVHNIALRATCNMMLFILSRKDIATNVIEAKDVTRLSSNIFTDDIERDLNRYKRKISAPFG